jgi:hypothetical protein
MESMCTKCGYYKTPPNFWSGTAKPLICNCQKKEITIDEIKDFILAIKPQQQGYSEEEVETIAKDAYAMGRNNILIGVFNKWFEQFKKKQND